MKQIEKLALKQKIQEGLDLKQQNLLERFVKQPEGKPKWKPSKEQRKEIKNKLLESQKYLCCYCECRLNKGNIHIEHFYEQTDKPDLIYVYANLFLSCEGDKDPIKMPETDLEKEQRIADTSCGHKKNKDYHSGDKVNYSELLNPSNDNSLLMVYNDEGIIECKSKEPSDNQKFDYTIKRLNLNSQKLEIRRFNLIGEITNEIKDNKMNLEEQKHYISRLLDEKRLEFPAYYSTIKDNFGFIVTN